MDAENWDVTVFWAESVTVRLKVAAPPYLYSGPSPVASLATVLAGLEVNERRGDELRRVVFKHTSRVLDVLRALGVHTPNRSGLPIVEIPLRDHEQIDAVGRLLFERGVYVTLAAYPLARMEFCGRLTGCLSVTQELTTHVEIEKAVADAAHLLEVIAS